jgi:hypothetical protein
MEVATRVYLLPEFRKVDFFLKIDNTEAPENVLKTQLLLNTIENVSTVYQVNTNQIKSKNNLIF